MLDPRDILAYPLLLPLFYDCLNELLTFSVSCIENG